MRRRRMVTALLAVVLAVLGATLITHYVRGADARALDGLSTVNVLVVTERVAQGTAAAALADSVTTKALPRLSVAPGTLTSLQAAGGRVAASDLQPGEQLLDSKFVDPASLVEEEEPDEVPLPAGLQEVSVSLERQRMLGAALAPGDRVGVVISIGAEGDNPAQTKLAVPQVLVLGVGEPTTEPTPAPGDAAAVEDAPAATAESLTVRLALDTEQTEKVVFGAEHGRLWLSRQPDDVLTPTPGAEPMTAEKVYE